MRYNFPAIIPAVAVRLANKIAERYYCLRSPLLSWLWGVRVGAHVLYLGKTLLRTHGGEITIGSNTKFVSNTNLNLVGLTGPTILETLKGGRISIGENSGFSSVVISSKANITIGNRVLVGGNVRIFDHDYHSVEASYRNTSQDIGHIRSRDVDIEDDCFIGTNAIILKGTHIGARSIVAAGSVLFGLEIPPDSLVKGNPAQVISRT